MIATISTRLDTTPQFAWQLVKRSETFLYVTRGVLGVSDSCRLPEEWSQGTVVQTRLSLFRFIPAWMHRLEIVRFSDECRELQTQEQGGLISSWKHRIQVEPTPDGRCRYTDEIEIHAGALTLPVWCSIHIFFRYRQMRLRCLVLRRIESNFKGIQLPYFDDRVK